MGRNPVGLKPVTGGLHRLKNDSAQVAKIQLNIPPGDELEVSDEVAAQLHAASTHFKDPADVPIPGPQVEKDANGVPIVEEPKKAPAKRASKKAPAATDED